MTRSLLVLVAALTLLQLAFASEPAEERSCIVGGKRMVVDARTWEKPWDRLEFVEISGRLIAQYPDGRRAPLRNARFYWGPINTDDKVTKRERLIFKRKPDGGYWAMVMVRVLNGIPGGPLEGPCIENSGLVVSARDCEERVVPIVSKWPEEIVLSCRDE